MVCRWFRLFSGGRENVHNEQWTGGLSLISDNLLEQVDAEI